MDRDNHYEAAFEAYLREAKLCYVPVNQAKRSTLDEEPVKSLDFVVHPPKTCKFLIDVKGRQFPSGDSRKPRLIWQTWCLQADVDGLLRWQSEFGNGFQSMLLFMFYLLPGVDVPLGTADLWYWRGKRYLLRGIRIQDYQANMRVRSPKWKTVDIPLRSFREFAQPFCDWASLPDSIIFKPITS